MQRREFVLSTGAAAAAGLTGCLHGGGNGDDGNQTDGDGNGNGGSEFTLVEDEPDYKGYFDGCRSYEDVGGTVDWTGQEEVTIMAGNDEYINQFYPPAVKVDQGTTVTWEWGTPGHNVMRASAASGTTAKERASSSNVDTGGDWMGLEASDIRSPPATYEHTFESTGIHLFVCMPHDAQRMYGAVVVEGDGGMDGGDDGGMDGNQTDTGGNETDTGGNETAE